MFAVLHSQLNRPEIPDGLNEPTHLPKIACKSLVDNSPKCFAANAFQVR